MCMGKGCASTEGLERGITPSHSINDNGRIYLLHEEMGPTGAFTVLLCNSIAVAAFAP